MAKQERVERLGEGVWHSLQRMVHELLARRSGAHLIENRLESLDLNLHLELRDDPAGPGLFSHELIGSIEEQLDDAVQHAAAFRPGHAFCHRCDSVACEHSQPPTCRHVFIGYGPTGTPRWIDLAQLCLERRHPDVDRLYDEPPAFVTLMHDRRELHGGILRAFRNRSHELLGQVTAGFFRVRTRAEEGRGVLALSLQAAASRSRRGTTRLGLNLLGRAPSGEPLSTLWERHDELPWRRAVQWAQAALQDVDDGSRGRSAPSRDVVERRVQAILLGLSRRLVRDQRARGRRTQHAERRHVSGGRPTRKALDDVREAAAQDCMFDERSRTLVVLGDRGRTHFFSVGGQHVSSVRYSREAITRKIERELWRSATVEEWEALRASLNGRTDS